MDNALGRVSHQYEVVNAPRLVHVGQGEQELQQVAQRGVQFIGAGLPCSSLLLVLLIFLFTTATTLALVVGWFRCGRSLLLLLLLACSGALLSIAIFRPLRLLRREPRFLLFLLVLLLLEALEAQPYLQLRNQIHKN